MERRNAVNDNATAWRGAWQAPVGWIAAVISVLAATSAIVMGRTAAVSNERSKLAAAAARGPRALVERAQTAEPQRKISVPATITGYSEAPLFAKIPGYLKEIRVDKGDQVSSGQILAILSSPELDEQVADARHNLWLQRVTNRRNQGLVLTHAISQQIADNSQGAELQALDTYRQLRAMQLYEIIKAPFEGIVTARYLDPGALVAQTITPSQSELLSHMSETATPILMLSTLKPLRVYASVPQDVANFIHDGGAAKVTVEQYPGRSFTGRITRHPQALDPATRMMLVEVDLPNSESALYPGMYGMMSFNVTVTSSAPLVPDDALIFRDDKVFVPVVRKSKVHLAPVTLGYDNGYAVEATGISRNDLIALDLGQSATEGEQVQPLLQNKVK
jgi:membrane fusion protein, multidrug efflux system